jgi:predicted Zn-dependent peptidase
MQIRRLIILRFASASAQACARARGALLCGAMVLSFAIARPASSGQVAEPPMPAEPGAAEEITLDRASGVSSAWLSNGVLVHHKVVEARGQEAEGRARARAEVVVTICVAGGELLETAANRGVSRAAATAWQRAGTRSMSGEEIEAYLNDNNVRLRGWAGADAMTLRISGPPGAIEAGLKVARLLLTEPVVSERGLERWKKEEAEGAGRQRRRGERVVYDAAVEMLFAPDEVRTRPVSAGQAARITAAEAQAWLDGMLTGDKPHPIEAAIVGDVEVRDAIVLAERYLGSLPRRERISAATFAASRAVKPAGPGPVVGRRRMDVPGGAAREREDDKAGEKGVEKAPENGEKAPEGRAERGGANPFVVAGFFGADIRDIDDHRALSAASRVLSARLAAELPVAENIGGDAGASSVPASVYPGFGLVLAVTEVEPGREESAMKRIDGVLARLREGPLGAEEVTAAKEQLATAAARLLGEAPYWSWMLATSTYHGVPPGALARAVEGYQGLTPERVLEVVRRYDKEARRIRVIVEGGPASAR